MDMVKKMIITFLLTCLTGTFVQVQAQDNPYITLEAYDLPGYFVTHAGTRGPVAVLTEAGDKTDAGKFYLVPGLANSQGVSFESMEFPGYYLRHRGYVIRLESDTSDIFNNDATWMLRPGLADPEAVSFESTAAFVGNYLIHDPTSPYGLRMGPVATNGAATWKLPPKDPKANFPTPVNGALYPDLWASLGWMSGGFAASHNVYFDDNFEDVNAGTEDAFWGNLAMPYYVVGFAGYPFPDGLVPGTTYYWRVDEVNDLHPDSPWRGNVWSFTVPTKKAYEPVPSDDAKYIDTNVTLAWTPGYDAKMHAVYFGEDYDTVSSATGSVPVAFTTYTPDALELGKVYYWRVDELDGVTTHTGDVWSFKTIPDILVTDPNLMGWWKFDEGAGATALDWSGQDNHGEIRGGTEWVDGYDGGALRLKGHDGYVNLPIGEVIASMDSSTITTWVNFSNAGSAWQRIFDFGSGTGTYIFLCPRTETDGPMRVAIQTGGGGESLIDSTSTLPTGWHHVAVVVISGNMQLYLDSVMVISGPTSVILSDLGQTGSNWLGRSQYAADGYFNGSLDDFRIYDYPMSADEIVKTMRGDPLLAWNAMPADGTIPDIRVALPLSWSAGEKASQHDVYFGTDADVVDNADNSTPEIYRGRQAGTSYTPPEAVEWGGGPYYWRVDEFNNDGTIREYGALR